MLRLTRSHERPALGIFPRWAVLAALGCVVRVGATAPSAELPNVVVTAKAPDLEEKSYPRMLAAMERFESYHRKFPDAELRFRVYPRKDETDMSQLVVYIADRQAGTRVDIDVAPDGSFKLPVLEDARRHDTVVRTSMPDGQLAWYIQIQRSGDDPRHRVLGDLREACRLELAGADLARTVKPPAFFVVTAVTDVCTLRGVTWGAYAEKPVLAVHLTHGTQHSSLPPDDLHGRSVPSLLYPLLDWTYRLRDRTYMIPPDDKLWPDDTLLDIDYVDDDPAATRSAP